MSGVAEMGKGMRPATAIDPEHRGQEDGMNYYTWAAGKSSPRVLALPAADDPLATTIRVALEARRIGLSPEHTLELMEQRGFGIHAEEIALPR